MCSINASSSPWDRTCLGSPLLSHAGHFIHREAIIKPPHPGELWPVLLGGRRSAKGNSSHHTGCPLHGQAGARRLRHELHPLCGPRRHPNSERRPVSAAGTPPSSPVPTPCHQEAASTGEAIHFGTPLQGGGPWGSTGGASAPKACVFPPPPCTSSSADVE